MTADSRGIKFRAEVACDGYANLMPSDVPEDVVEMDDYLRGAHDAAEAIRAALSDPVTADRPPAREGLGDERREALARALDPVLPEAGFEGLFEDVLSALAPLLAEWSAQDRAEALREAADEFEVRRDEWYGESIFGPDFTPGHWALIDSVCADHLGHRIDRLSANYYRRVMTRDAALLRARADEIGPRA